MPNGEKKGITVRIDADLHAEVSQYLRDHSMTTVFNTCTSQYEDVEVTREVYNEFRRGEWRIEKNDDKHHASETPFSELIGGDDGVFENFSEFIHNSVNPESIFAANAQIKALYSAMSMLSDLDKQLLQALFFDGSQRS